MLGYAELFHPNIHGLDESSYPNIEGFFMTIMKIQCPNEYLSLMENTRKMNKDDYVNYVTLNRSKAINYQREILFHIKMRNKIISSIPPHPSIRNFSKVYEQLTNPDSLHIIEMKELHTGEIICILKTFWLKCIQRKWKKICKYNDNIISEMKKIPNLHKRELKQISKKTIGITGMWYLSI